jgi:hypothetical protein
MTSRRRQTMTAKLFEPWPAWVDRPVGVVLRIVGALSALAFGGLLVVLGNFGASYKQTSAIWDAQAIALVVAGVVIALAGLVWAFKPSRLTMGVAVAVVAVALLNPFSGM